MFFDRSPTDIHSESSQGIYSHKRYHQLLKVLRVGTKIKIMKRPTQIYAAFIDNPITALGTTTVAVYLLVVIGATASLGDAAAACTTWPICSGATNDLTMAVATGHRLLAFLTGVLLLATTYAIVYGDTSGRVTAPIAVALVLYPLQMAHGALLSITAGSPPIPWLHLGFGLTIFGTLVLALAWQLEYETGSADEPLHSEDMECANSELSSVATILSEQPLGTRLKGRMFAYFQLMKPRLMWLLCLVAVAAMALAAGSALETREILLTIGGGVLAIGASGTFNHVFERDVDRKMSRTNDRPLVTHQLPKRNAILFGIALTVLSTIIFLQLNSLTAALGLIAILFYSVIYTLVLKPNTVQNTVIGGAAGALPALIGWAAVTGRIGITGIALAAVIFVWTPAHFYNLALAYKEDYARGGFPMMSVVRGETTTRKHIVLWLGTTLAATTVLIWFTQLSWLVAVTTAFVGIIFLWATIRLHHEQTKQAAFRAFHASNAYLGAVLLAIVVDAIVI